MTTGPGKARAIMASSVARRKGNFCRAVEWRMGHLGEEPKGIYANRQERVAGWFRSVTIQRRVSPAGPLCKSHQNR